MPISPKSLANLHRDGRPPSFTEAEALAVLTERCSTPGVTLREFMENERRGGCLPRPVSVSSLMRLLDGKTFPDLIDPSTGLRYDYSKVPRAAPGGRKGPEEEGGLDPLTNRPRKGLSRFRQKMLDMTMEECRRVTDRRSVYYASMLRQEFDGRIAELQKRIDALEARHEG